MAYNNGSRSAYKGNNNSSKGNEIAQLNAVTQHLVSLETDFMTAASWNPSLSFAKESIFAKHVINNSKYLTELASQNLKSFEVAFLQLATSGLSLDPAQKLAYLVPRMGRVFLDVSYLGLSRMATDEGLCENIVVELVFENDDFKSNGRRQSPEHSFDPFADKGLLNLTDTDPVQDGSRGKFRGVYVDYLMKNGSNMVYFLTRQELAQARSVSESWKKVDERDKSPWTRFPWAMVRKSAIKQTIFQIPGNRTRVSSIIDYLNKDGGEGFRDVNATPVQSAEYEMSARQAAHRHDVKPGQEYSQPASSGKVYEGEVVSAVKDEVKPETPVQQEQKEPVNVNTTSASETQPNNSEVNGHTEEMSDVPGVRAAIMRRIDKLVKRMEHLHSYEMMIAEVKTAFQFNASEITYAVHCLEKSRRNLLQSKLTDAVNKCDFTDVDKFINAMPECEFKSNSTTFVQDVRSQTNDLRVMYDEALQKNDFTAVYSALENITFEPLKKVLSEMISTTEAA